MGKDPSRQQCRAYAPSLIILLRPVAAAVAVRLLADFAALAVSAAAVVPVPPVLLLLAAAVGIAVRCLRRRVQLLVQQVIPVVEKWVVLSEGRVMCDVRLGAWIQADTPPLSDEGSGAGTEASRRSNTAQGGVSGAAGQSVPANADWAHHAAIACGAYLAAASAAAFAQAGRRHTSQACHQKPQVTIASWQRQVDCGSINTTSGGLAMRTLRRSRLRPTANLLSTYPLLQVLLSSRPLTVRSRRRLVQGAHSSMSAMTPSAPPRRRPCGRQQRVHRRWCGVSRSQDRSSAFKARVPAGEIRRPAP